MYLLLIGRERFVLWLTQRSELRRSTGLVTSSTGRRRHGACWTHRGGDRPGKTGGAKPVGYLCEMMGDDGRMLRRPQLQEFSKKHELPLVTISDLIRYRSRTDTLVQRTEAKATTVPTPFGDFVSVEYKSLVQKDQTYHALIFGNVSAQKNAPVFLVEDGFDAELQAQWAQKHVASHGSGVLIYIHGASQLLQISGELMARQSIFGMAMQIVRDLKVESVRLLTTAELGLDPNGFGIEIAGSERLAMSA